MAITYPVGLDTLSNPLATDPTLNPGNELDHARQHGDENDLLEALMAKVGVNGSAVASSLDYKVTTHLAATLGVHGVAGALVGTTDTQTLTGKSISGASNVLTAIPQSALTGAPAGALVGTTDTQTLTGKTISGASNTITNVPKASVVGAPAGAFVGDTDAQTLTGKTISGASNTITAIPQASVVGAPAGAFVGTTDTQTLTGKTISGASNTLSNVPQSAVTGLATALALYTPITRQKPGGQSVTSSIVVVNDADIVFTLAANRVYKISAYLAATGALLGDLRVTWAVTGTAFQSVMRSCIGPSPASKDVSGATSNTVSPYDSGIMRCTRANLATEVVYGTDGTNTTSVVEEFAVAGGASGGTLQMRWAQGTSSATSTVLTIDSWAEARPVG